MDLRSFPYPGRVLLHLVLVAMGAVGVAPPEAALTKLVAVALLAPVPKAHHALAPAIRTFHRMEDCSKKHKNKLGHYIFFFFYIYFYALVCENPATFPVLPVEISQNI